MIMPYPIVYNRIAEIISLKRVSDPGIVMYALKFKVGKQKFTAYLGSNICDEQIRHAIKINYEQQTRDRRETEYKNSLPGSKINFVSPL